MSISDKLREDCYTIFEGIHVMQIADNTSLWVVGK